MADIVGPSDVDQGLAGFPPRYGVLALVVRQFRLAAHDYTLGFGALTALAGTAADQFPFELGKAAQDGQHESAVFSRCRRGMDPRPIRLKSLSESLLLTITSL
jgi:hypothetical protein